MMALEQQTKVQYSSSNILFYTIVLELRTAVLLLYFDLVFVLSTRVLYSTIGLLCFTLALLIQRVECYTAYSASACDCSKVGFEKVDGLFLIL